MTARPREDLLLAARQALVEAIGGEVDVSRGDDVDLLTWEDDEGTWRAVVDASALLAWLQSQRLEPGTGAWRQHWSDVATDVMETVAHFGVAGSPYRFEPGRGLRPRAGTLGLLEREDLGRGGCRRPPE